MTISEFKKIGRLLKTAYTELEQEALNEGVDILSAEYQDLVDKVRLAVLGKYGYSLEEYQQAKMQAASLSKEEQILFDNQQKTESKLKEVENRYIPTKQDIEAIAREVAQEYIKPPQIINQIVEKTTVEKPKIIKETVKQRVEYNDKPLKESLRKFEDELKKRPVIDKDELSKELLSKSALLHEDYFSNNFQKNIDIVWGQRMPDFRKLAMGLQGQIDEIRSEESNETGNGSGSSLQTLTLSPAFDGVTTVFTLSDTPTTTLFLYLNGQLLEDGGVNYTLSGATVTFVIAPDADDSYQAYAGIDVIPDVLTPTTGQYKVYVTVGFEDADYICDGIADDVEINQALRYVENLGGGIVFVKIGTFDITSAIKVGLNTSLSGSGIGTLFKANASLTSGFVVTQNDSTSLNTIFRDFKIDGNNVVATYGIRTKASTTNIYLNGITVVNCTATCIYTNTNQYITAENIYTDGGDNGIGFASSKYFKITKSTAINAAKNGIWVYKSSYGSVIGNYVASNGIGSGGIQGGIWIFSDTSGSPAEYNVIDGNIVYANNDGIGTDDDYTANNIISNNNVYSNDNIGIHISAPGNNNKIIGNNTYSNGSDGIRITGGVNVTVIGNNATDNGANGMNASMSASVITGNTFTGNTSNGAYFNTSGDLDISGNRMTSNGQHGVVLKPNNTLVDSPNINFTGNTVSNNGSTSAGTYDGVHIQSDTSFITNTNITGNRIFDNQTIPTQRYGIYSTTTDNSPINLSGNSIDGNISGSLNGNVKFSGTNTNIDRTLIVQSPNASGTNVSSLKFDRSGSNPFATFDVGSTGATQPLVQIASMFSSSSSNQVALRLLPEISQSGTAGYTMLLVNPTETSLGSGTKLLADFQAGGSSKFKVSNTGVAFFTGELCIEDRASFGSEGSISPSESSYILHGEDSTNRTLRLGVSNDSYTRGEIELTNGNQSYSDILLKTTTTTGGALTRMTVYRNGNVGIGETVPTALLSVGLGSLFQVNSSGAIAAATGVTSSGTIAFSGLSSNGLVKTSGGTGTLSIATAGTDYEVPLTFSTGLTRSTNTVTNNLSTGISGGQTIIGGTASGDDLTISTTSNGTKGNIFFGTSTYDEVNNRLGIRSTGPLTTGLFVTGSATDSLQIRRNSGSASEEARLGFRVSTSESATNLAYISAFRTDSPNSGDISLRFANQKSGTVSVTLTLGTDGSATFSNNIISGAAIRLKGYTVATLPAGTTGDTAYVTDALAPTFGATVTGGGSVVIPVFYNGSTWVSY